ncbi:MAG: hypothetical protein ACK5WY_07715 [Holosporaceae bacterium]
MARAAPATDLSPPCLSPLRGAAISQAQNGLAAAGGIPLVDGAGL